MTRWRRSAATVTALVMLTAGCSSGKPATHGTTGAAASVSGTVTVFAAASLTEVFTSLAKAFEAAHPATTVRLDFGASSALALQIGQGAPADVFASAAPKNMQQVITAGAARTSVTFAKNVLEIAVPPTNPAHVATVRDLGRAGIKVALCEPQVPCGAVAAQVFAKAGVRVHPVTLEADVKSTLSKVELGEVDAGVVYVTDVRAAGTKVAGVMIPAAVNASTQYPIAVLTKARNSAGAQAFVDFVLSAQGRAVLLADGFQAP